MISLSQTPMGRLVERRATALVAEALTDTRVVLIEGARQCGKSTVAAQIAATRDGAWRSLDNPVVRSAAHDDPESFVHEDRLIVIDEVQRAPEILLSIKETVDADQRPGRFLLTGSARVLGLRALPDALPGRMETIQLWPLSQGEIDGGPDSFVDAIFERGADFRHVSLETRAGYIARIVRGGFPEAIARQGRRRIAFLDNYVADLVNRDVVQLSEIERGAEMRQLVGLLAARSGQLLVAGALANELRLPQSTVERYIRLLEEVFLIKRVRAWSRNLSSRAISTAKVAMVDSAVGANLLGQDQHGLQRIGSPLGGLLEAFTMMEIARQSTWSLTLVEMSHYRTRDQVEVDIVLEDRLGRVVAIDVKASSTVRSEDFRGINHLAARLGPDLLVGVVLYTGAETFSFGDRRLAVPLAALWEAG